MAKQSPVQRIWELGKDQHGRLITAVVLAVVGVVGGMVPYFAAAKIIVGLVTGETALSAYTPWLAAALIGYLVRTALYNSALSLSHKATFQILKSIRQQLLQKLPKLPLGTVMDTSSGKLKETIVDQVDSMEKNVQRGVGGKEKKEEFECLCRILAVMKEGKDVRAVRWSANEVEVINTYQLLSAKPIVYLCNLSEKNYILRKDPMWW